MTNTFIVTVWVLWSTNVFDTALNPAGDDILRSTVVSQTHVYRIPGFPSATNTVAVSTNSDQFHRLWVKLPPVPNTTTNK